MHVHQLEAHVVERAARSRRSQRSAPADSLVGVRFRGCSRGPRPARRRCASGAALRPRPRLVGGEHRAHRVGARSSRCAASRNRVHRARAELVPLVQPRLALRRAGPGVESGGVGVGVEVLGSICACRRRTPRRGTGSPTGECRPGGTPGGMCRSPRGPRPEPGWHCFERMPAERREVLAGGRRAAGRRPRPAHLAPADLGHRRAGRTEPPAASASSWAPRHTPSAGAPRRHRVAQQGLLRRQPRESGRGCSSPRPARSAASKPGAPAHRGPAARYAANPRARRSRRRTRRARHRPGA